MSLPPVLESVSLPIIGTPSLVESGIRNRTSLERLIEDHLSSDAPGRSSSMKGRKATLAVIGAGDWLESGDL